MSTIAQLKRVRKKRKLDKRYKTPAKPQQINSKGNKKK